MQFVQFNWQTSTMHFIETREGLIQLAIVTPHLKVSIFEVNYYLAVWTGNEASNLSLTVDSSPVGQRFKKSLYCTLFQFKMITYLDFILLKIIIYFTVKFINFKFDFRHTELENFWNKIWNKKKLVLDWLNVLMKITKLD